MFKTIAAYIAAKFLTPAELLKLGYVSDKLSSVQAMEAASALVERHQYRYGFTQQENFFNKVLNILSRRTCDGTTFAYLKGRVVCDATRDEILIIAGERAVMDVLASTDRIDTLSYPAIFHDFVLAAALSEERNPIKARAALVKVIKAELGEITNDVAQLIAALAEQVAKD